MITKKKTVRSLAAVVLAVAAAGAHAGTYQFYNSTGSLFGTMTTGFVLPGNTGTAFTLALASGLSSAAKIDYVNLAGPGGTFANTTATTVVSSVTSSYNAAGFTDAGSKYNWRIGFPGSNNDKLTFGETASWNIVVTDPNAWNFNLLHIQAWDGSNSIKLSSCEVVTGSTNCSPPKTNIPEPGTLALFGAALLAAAAVRRKSAAAV